MILMENKTEEMCKKAFEILCAECETIFGGHLSPGFISTGYEIAAIRVTFPNCRICGCLFHFSQILWRKVQAVELAQEGMYRDNDEIRTQFHLIVGLALIPDRSHAPE